MRRLASAEGIEFGRRAARILKLLDRLKPRVVAASGRHAVQLSDEPIQKHRLGLEVQGRAAGYGLLRELTVLRLLPARDVQPAWFGEVQSRVESATGVFRSELSEPQVEEPPVETAAEPV